MKKENYAVMDYKNVFLIGNISEGLYPLTSIYSEDNFLDDTLEQVDYITNNYPFIEGITTYFITGNKDVYSISLLANPLGNKDISPLSGYKKATAGGQEGINTNKAKSENKITCIFVQSTTSLYSKFLIVFTSFKSYHYFFHCCFSFFDFTLINF